MSSRCALIGVSAHLSTQFLLLVTVMAHYALDSWPIANSLCQVFTWFFSLNGEGLVVHFGGPRKTKACRVAKRPDRDIFPRCLACVVVSILLCVCVCVWLFSGFHLLKHAVLGSLLSYL